MKDMWKPAYFGLFPAISAALIAVVAAGAPASAQTTPVDAAAPGQVTYTKDVAPILQEKCQTCHRSGGIAPMSLLTYQQAKAYSKAIRQRVVARTMPPWFLDKTVGVQHFTNDISLNDQQIATIAKWVDEGTPEGNSKDAPPAKVFDESNDWRLVQILGRKPDMVIEGPDFTVKAHDQDQWPRPHTEVTGLTGPRWVMAVEMRTSTPTGRRVFHHILANLYQDETNAPSALVPISLPRNGMKMDGGDSSMGGMLMEYAIGKNYDIYRPGTAKLLMPGARINWEYHTHSTNVDVTDHPQLGIYFYPEGYTPQYRTYLTAFPAYQRTTLSIPPNTIDETQGFTVLKAAARLENFQPHMHLRGKAMAIEAILPDGNRQMISSVDHFNFNWMTNYIYADDAAPEFPKGTIIHVMAWHDNTAANPGNPDPNQWVGYGERTVDEMAHAWVNVTYVSDADYEAWAAKHKAKMKNGE
jgi:mono/diheme cytochrome c family protein